jgi:hypothetical protein
MSAPPLSALLLLLFAPSSAGCHAAVSSTAPGDAATSDVAATEGAAPDAGPCSCGLPVDVVPGTEATCQTCIDAHCAGAAAGCASVCCPALDDTCENGGRAPYAQCIATECSTECAACAGDPSLGCAGNASGYACSSGSSPDAGASAGPPALACTIPISGEGGTVDVCCFPWTYGPAQCIPLPRPLPSCAPGSYTFNCGAGDSPTSLDPSLTCAAPTPDVDGTVDYCCTRP